MTPLARNLMAALTSLGLFLSAAASAAVPSCPPPAFPLGSVSFTISPGSEDCGGPGLVTPPSPPFSGDILDGTGAKVGDLGLGCFYLGGGRATSLPAAKLPDGSMSLLDVSTVNGLSLGLAASRGTGPANCTRGAGPLRHCVNGNPGTDGSGLCGSDADCGGGVGNCQLDANCLFGAKTITAIGTPGGDLTDAGANPSTLVSVFSIPPTFNATIDAAANLPGPGAVALPGNTDLCSSATTCP